MSDQASAAFSGDRHHWARARAELIADGIVHTVGIVLAIAAGSALLSLAAFHARPGEYVAAIFYVVSLLTVLSVSLAYNLWPSTPVKLMLRRFDHAAIYLLIAATYTLFLAQLTDAAAAGRMILLVWSAAALGIALKLFAPGRFDGLAVLFYLAIGWSGVVILQPLLDTLSRAAIGLIVAGGIVYSLGVIVYVSKRLRFRSAVWHGFVVAGAGLHFAAVIDSLVVARL